MKTNNNSKQSPANLIRFFKLIVLLGSVLCMFGCASETLDPDGKLQANVEPQLVEAAKQAVAEWGRATHGRVSVQVVESGGDAVLVRGVPRVGAMMTTFRDSSGVRIVVGSDVALDAPIRATKALLMHELGHAFGLEHVRGGLMDPGGAWCIDLETAKRFCQSYGCANGYESTCPAN